MGRRAGEARDIAHGETVLRCKLPQPVDANHATRAAHVADDEGGIAGNVPAEMTRKETRFRVRRTAGCVVHDKRDLPALVELGGIGMGCIETAKQKPKRNK